MFYLENESFSKGNLWRDYLFKKAYCYFDVANTFNMVLITSKGLHELYFDMNSIKTAGQKHSLKYNTLIIL